MKRVGIFLVAVALVVGMVGCVGIKYNLTTASTSGGSVTTPGEGASTYYEGTVVNLVAEAEEGYQFVNWTGDVGTVANVNAASTTITMNDNYSITANFNYLGPRQVITLDFATFWGEFIDFQADGFRNWMSTITDVVEANTPNDSTGYTVEWNVSWGIPRDVLWWGVTNGTYDVITSGPDFIGGIMPLWEGPEYAGGLYRKNALTMSMTLQALYDEFTPLQDEMDNAGVKVMHFWSAGPGYFLMTEGNDVRTLEDFAALDKPIRIPNTASVLTIEALGAEALKCLMGQALEEFNAGTISGILCPTDTPKAFGMDAYIKHCTFAPFSFQFVLMKVMCQDTWDELPEDVQDCFDEVNAAWPEYYGKLRTWGEAEGLEYCYEEIDGFTYYDLPNEDPAEYQSWVDATAHLVDDWIGGDATRQALWDEFVELDEYYATTPPYNTWTPDASPPPVPTFR